MGAKLRRAGSSSFALRRAIVDPAEVENGIYGHPDVTEVVVIGVPANEATVIAWAGERIGVFKAPKSVDFMERCRATRRARWCGGCCGSGPWRDGGGV
jgi:acyl-CoA synthetase (AMP-forming)/AMP-acid ligase II